MTPRGNSAALVDTAAASTRSATAAVIVDTRRISGGGCALQLYTHTHTEHMLTRGQGRVPFDMWGKSCGTDALG
jgi:hypothetical protein